MEQFYYPNSRPLEIPQVEYTLDEEEIQAIELSPDSNQHMVTQNDMPVILNEKYTPRRRIASKGRRTTYIKSKRTEELEEEGAAMNSPCITCPLDIRFKLSEVSI